MLPQLCRFLSNLRCDNRMQLRIARNEQDGALNACNDLAPWSSVSNRCECRLQDVDIQLSFGVSPGDDFLFGPVGIQGEAPGDALLAWECSEFEEPLPPVLLLLLPTCLKQLLVRSCLKQWLVHQGRVFQHDGSNQVRIRCSKHSCSDGPHRMSPHRRLFQTQRSNDRCCVVGQKCNRE